jgi:hypothetical protein
MVGQTVGRMWVEGQAGEYALLGGEGNVATGAFVYRLYQPNTFTDAVGTADQPIVMRYRPYFKSAGTMETEKYLRAVQVEANPCDASASLSVFDLNGAIVTNVPLVPVPA